MTGKASLLLRKIFKNSHLGVSASVLGVAPQISDRDLAFGVLPLFQGVDEKNLIISHCRAVAVCWLKITKTEVGERMRENVKGIMSGNDNELNILVQWYLFHSSLSLKIPQHSIVMQNISEVLKNGAINVLIYLIDRSDFQFCWSFDISCELSLHRRTTIGN